MKQILQNIKTGETYLVEAPIPSCTSGAVLIQTRKSLVSTGTERMVVEFGRSNLLQKALQQPDKVKQVLNKIKTDGLLTTLESVKNKLDYPIALGYCNVGVVLETAPDVTDLKPGDRVVSNGYHAEVVTVKRNLCARIPDHVSDETASFTVISSIALQGVRLAQPTLGETFVVMGLGLIGLITVQLLRAHGCQVIGIDLDPNKLKLAQNFGADVIDLSVFEDPILAAQQLNGNQPIDGVIITAATDSNTPIHQAACMCRKRGRIILVGVVGLNFSRADFYEKELTFQISCSYGPGRYDPEYEDNGNDYPIGFVRWTENRNFQAILSMMANQKLNVAPLITHRFALNDAEKAYDTLIKQKPMGIVLDYPSSNILPSTLSQFKTIAVHTKKTTDSVGQKTVTGFIGAGNYANHVLIPAFKKTQTALEAVVTHSSMTSYAAAKRHGIHQASTDLHSILENQQINTIVIATRHNSHAELVIQALKNKKHVFVEKPLALTSEELKAIRDVYEQLNEAPLLMVGFNRRFSPFIKKIQQLLNGVHAPKSFIMTVNAGFLPTEHWTQDSQIGGGRMIGEGCHFIDLLRYLAASPITHYQVAKLSDKQNDTFSVNLSFANGSIGTIHYFSNGSKALSKERLEIYCQGKILLLDNYKKLTGYGWSHFKRQKSWKQDKGQAACAQAFISAIENGLPSPIPFEELMEVSQITIDIAETI